MGLDQKEISLEKALGATGHHEKKLYARHLQKILKTCVKEGKTLRIQFKKLV
jgi:hypothetical protein